MAVMTGRRAGPRETVQAAVGGHPTYDPQCGARRRFAHGLGGVVSDWVVWGSGRFAFRAATTPLVDIARTPWACWQGHFGVARPSGSAPPSRSSIELTIDQNVLVAGPRAPLWNAENGHLAADGPPGHGYGFCAGGADPLAPETAAPETRPHSSRPAIAPGGTVSGVPSFARVTWGWARPPSPEARNPRHYAG